MARIAVVGAGVSGLTAAHALGRQGHEVVVFEAGERAGGHTHTVAVGDLAVDMGFIVLNDRNYPGFTALLDDLGVAVQPSEMSFAVTSQDGSFEYSSASLGGLFTTLPRPAYARMLLDVRRFQREAAELLDSDDDVSLGDYLERNRYSRWFIDRLLVPQASAVWSADPAQMWTFPARFLARFFHNHGMLALRDRPQWFTVAGGSQTYVRALTATMDVRAGTPVRAIRRHATHVELSPGGVFDEVVVATHSDQALRLLADPTPAERGVLGAMPYEDNEVVLHTDRSLLPRRRRAWASWVYHLLDEPTGKTTVSYHMNRLQSLVSDQELIVTLNRTDAIDPGAVLEVQHFAHPVFTPEGMAAQEAHHLISGVNRTHYAGAYWRWGFHEDGVWSGLRAAASVGEIPELTLAA
jgi:predicted NAD/FAD-binding protein